MRWNSRRPVAVTMVASLFIISGVFGLVYHTSEYIKQMHLNYEEIFVLLLRVLAVVIGLFLLRGANWSRWLALAWVAYHAVLGIFHSTSDAIIHFALLIVIAIMLFFPKTAAYFRIDVNNNRQSAN